MVSLPGDQVHGRPARSALAIVAWRAAFAIAVAAAVGAAQEDAPWTVECASDCNGVNTCTTLGLCSGTESQEMGCPNSPPCPTAKYCTPKPCTWSEWSKWQMEPFTGLCNRSRTFIANECGGTPCIGRMIETKFCYEAVPKNSAGGAECELSIWGEWEACQEDISEQDYGQRKRRRTVTTPPNVPCTGILQQTEPCHGIKTVGAQDCKVSEWLQWSGCSHSCGGGQQTRVRSVLKKATSAGKPCNTNLTEVEPCGAEACPGEETAASKREDCMLSDWSGWSLCTGAERQRSRSRTIKVKAANGGTGCNESLAEVGVCPNVKEAPPGPVNCELADWNDWVACDKTCDGGQTWRTRGVAVPASRGGLGCVDVMNETKPCQEISCEENPSAAGNCMLAEWGEWSRCSSDCGQGLETRKRTIDQEASPGGYGCNAQMTEVRPCKSTKACETRDCKWGTWSEWGECSRTCNTGYRSRARKIDVEPTQGGKPCEAKGKTAEVEPCNTEQCADEVCANGTWAAWDDWGTCSATCEGGLRWRHRKVGVPASPCGKDPTGPTIDYDKCAVDVPCVADEDCELMPWTEWGTCSKKCEGLQSRNRVVKTPNQGKGKTCDGESLKEMRSCNGPSDANTPQECGFGSDKDCLMSDWQDWSTCTKTCGEGHQFRIREVTQEPTGEGKLCDGSFKVVRTCSPQACHKEVDCDWSSWSDWSSCSRQCAGEKTRWRHMETLAQHGGRPCDPKKSQEIKPCPDTCTSWCVWTEWSTSGNCSKTCGSGSYSRSRHLDKLTTRPPAAKIVGVVYHPLDTCDATEREFLKCPDLPACNDCKPRDCVLSAWAEWGPASFTGLCNRTRKVTMAANSCGKGCDGPLIQTKDCESKAVEPTQKCEFSLWTTWSVCGAQDSQQTRQRTIGTQPGALGEGCEGPAEQTRPCGPKEESKADCTFGEWEQWGQCTSTCVGSYQVRKRDIASRALGGGMSCAGPLRMTAPCGTEKCNDQALVDCEYSTWSDWAGCTGKGIHTQGTRDRTVERQAENGGLPCKGNLQETGPCPQDIASDCQWQAWAPWGTCDKTCGAGMRFRTKEKARPWHGGKPCTGKTHESDTCNNKPCDANLDCKFELWSNWTACTATCGSGYQTRERHISQPAKEGGQGCNDKLKEVKACMGNQCPEQKDCKWGEWSDWGACVFADVCGVGSRNRTRDVVQMPVHGGKPCDAIERMEMKPSGTCAKSCCTPSEWTEWTAWGTCSVSCGSGGTRLRQRVVRVDPNANPCDQAPKGLSQEFEGCDAGIPCADVPPSPNDCALEPWSPWSDCSATCNGQREQSRKASRYALAGGKPCEGELKRIEHCNPADGEAAPAGCIGSEVPVDCVLEEWKAWSPCSITCGTLGQQTRERAVVTPPKFGGKACNSSLKELASCGSADPCTGGDAGATGVGDCQWEDWQDWLPCDSTGEQRRMRDTKPKGPGGAECIGPSEEVKACAMCPATTHTCAWSEWSAWSKCSVTCGPGGRINRTRNLVATPTSANQAKFSLDMVSSPSAAAHPDAASQQELVVAFVGGFASLLAVLSLGRVTSNALTATDRRPSAGVEVDENRGLNFATRPLAREARAEDIEGQ